MKHGYNKYLVVINDQASYEAGYEWQVWERLMDNLGYEFWAADILVVEVS